MSTQASANIDTGTVRSDDGTEIAWSRQGSGPALVMIHCVGVSRATTPQPTLGAALAEHFTVLEYDRRGKGQSGNTMPYAVEREFEDLRAVMDLAEGPVDVYGFSSGATLGLLAAEAGVPIRRLALLEPPLFGEDDPTFALRAEAQRQIDADLAGGRRWFDTEIVGVPAEILDEMPPPGPEALENGRTIVHELTFLPGTPAERFAEVATPTRVFLSDHTAPVMDDFAAALVAAMPEASKRTLPGEWHGVDDATLSTAMAEYLLT